MAWTPKTLKDRRDVGRGINSFFARYGIKGRPHVRSTDAVLNLQRYKDERALALRLLGIWNKSAVSDYDAARFLSHPSEYLDNPDLAGSAGIQRHKNELAAYRRLGNSYVFPYPFINTEGRVDRGQDIDSNTAHPPIVAIANGQVAWTWGGWPELGLTILDGPLKGRQVFYGHCYTIDVSNGQRVSAGQRLGTGGGPSEGGYDGHIEIGLWPVRGSVDPNTHNTDSGNEFHDFLHSHWPDKIGKNRIIG